MSSRILLINDDLIVTGIGKIVVFIANELAKRNLKVAVFAGSNGELWGHLENTVQRFPQPQKNRIKAKVDWIRALRKIAVSREYDIFHTHQRGVSLMARIASLGTGIKIVEHVHNVFTSPSNNLFSFRGHHLIACGTAVNKMLVENYGRNPGIVTTVMNAVPDASTPEISEPAHYQTHVNNDFKVIAIGRVNKQKDPSRFIEAVRIAVGKGLKIQATWVGTGILLEEMRALVISQGMQEYIHFIGQSDDVDGLLNSSDVLVSTSRWEGLPLTIIEAMSHGVPTIAPDVGSCSDAVVDGITGILYPVEAQPETIAEHLVSASSDRSRLSEWGVNGRSVYEFKFTPDRMIESLLDVYSNVLAGHNHQ